MRGQRASAFPMTSFHTAIKVWAIGCGGSQEEACREIGTAKSNFPLLAFSVLLHNGRSLVWFTFTQHSLVQTAQPRHAPC